MNNKENDKRLLEGLAVQDKESVEIIYKDNFPMIQNLILNNRGNTEDAADIFQEAMIVLYEKSINPEFILTCQISTYLYSVSRRLWLKKLQQNSKSKSSQIDDFENIVSVDEDLDLHKKRQADFEMMELAMAKLGEPCKSLLEAFYIQKKQMQEIADALHYTNADNAKTQKYKCLVRLKKLFFASYKNGN